MRHDKLVTHRAHAKFIELTYISKYEQILI